MQHNIVNNQECVCIFMRIPVKQLHYIIIIRLEYFMDLMYTDYTVTAGAVSKYSNIYRK